MARIRLQFARVRRNLLRLRLVALLRLRGRRCQSLLGPGNLALLSLLAGLRRCSSRRKCEVIDDLRVVEDDGVELLDADIGASERGSTHVRGASLDAGYTATSARRIVLLGSMLAQSHLDLVQVETDAAARSLQRIIRRLPGQRLLC